MAMIERKDRHKQLSGVIHDRSLDSLVQYAIVGRQDYETYRDQCLLALCASKIAIDILLPSPPYRGSPSTISTYWRVIAWAIDVIDGVGCLYIFCYVEITCLGMSGSCGRCCLLYLAFLTVLYCLFSSLFPT